MKKFIYTLIAAIAFTLGTTTAKAETHFLDLDKSIAIAKMQSLDMLSLKQDLKIAEYNLKSATSRLKTHVDLSLWTPNYSQEVTSYEDSSGVIYYSKNQLRYSGDLTISQPLPTDGRIYVASGLSSISDFNNDNRIMNMNTRLGLVQPIDALYGYNEIKSAVKSAELRYSASEKRLKRQELYLVYTVSQAFYAVLSTQKGAEFAGMNLERQKEAYLTAKNKYEAGLIREVDALQMEVDLANAQNGYDLALIRQAESQNNFKELIGIDLGDSVIISDKMLYKPVVVDVNEAVEMALKNRSEIQEGEINIELSKLNLKAQKAEGMIRGDLNTTFSKSGYNRDDLDVSISNSLNNSYNEFSSSKPNFSIGLSINIPIIDWGENRAKVRASEAELQKQIYEKEATKRSIETSVKNLVANLNSSLKRLQLLEKNVAVAEKSFEITRARFSDGDIDSQSLALERDRLNNAYTSHLSAYITYELALADLMRATFYDYKNSLPVE